MRSPQAGPTSPGPTWTRPRDAAVLFACGATAPAVWRVAVVVGTILSVVNQGAVIAAGEASAGIWLRVAFNYLVPYVVASIGFLKACRHPGEGAGPEPQVDERPPGDERPGP